MIVGITQTEAITFGVLGFFYLAALLLFILALWRGKIRPLRALYRMGIFIERRNGEEEDDEHDDARRD